MILLKNCDLYITLEDKFRFHDYYIIHSIKPKHIAGINPSLKCIDILLLDYGNDVHIAEYFIYLLKLGGLQDEFIFRDYTPLCTTETMHSVSKFCHDNQIAFAPWGASKHRRLNDNVIIKISELITNHGYNTAHLLISLTLPSSAFLSA